VKKSKLLMVLTVAGLCFCSAAYADIAKCQAFMNNYAMQALQKGSFYMTFFNNAAQIPEPNPGSNCVNNSCSYFVDSDGICLLADTSLWNKPIGNTGETVGEIATKEVNNFNNGIPYDGHSATIAETCPAGAGFNNDSCTLTWVQDH